MKYLRHFPFTLWVAVAALLGALLVAAWMNGQETNLAPYTAKYQTSERPAALAALQRVSGVYPALASGETGPWAVETASQFDKALKEHVRITGSEDDTLGIAWYNAKVAALNLAAAPEGKQHEYAAALGQAVQYVTAVVDGMTLAPAGKAELVTPEKTVIGKALEEGKGE